MRALVAVIAIAVLAVAGYIAWDGFRSADEQQPVADSGAPEAAPAAPAPGGAPPSPPTFDVVRISPEGTAVIAGRAEPGAAVTITEGETVIAEVTADARGEWVALPEAPIEPGTRELAQTERTAGGETVESESVIVLVVPERAAAPKTEDSAASAAPSAPGALAVLVPRESGTSRVLQAPSAGVGIKGEANLSLDTIDYDEKGKVALSGRGGEGAEVRVYMDDRLIGEAQVDPQSGWRVEPEAPVAEGLHRLRVEQVDAAGKVVARIETPFSRAGFRLPLAGESLAIVQPGNSLWRIARRAYGGGLKYVVIYEANRDQIRDEDLIYPGQIFVMPRVN